MKKAAAKEWIPNSAETDAELSEGEFTDEESMRRYYIQSHIREMEIGIKKRGSLQRKQKNEWVVHLKFGLKRPIERE